MRLCFGTFAYILCSGKSYHVTDPKLVGTMTRTVDSTCGYIKNAPRVSKILSCAENLSDGQRRRQVKGESELPLSKVISEAKKANKEVVIDRFKGKVVPLIYNEKKANNVSFMRFNS